MGDAADHELEAVYKDWTGKKLKRHGRMPKRGEVARRASVSKAAAELVSGEDLVLLQDEFQRRGLGAEGKAAMIRRQLRGRDQIRTRQDLVSVLAAVRAMNRRDGLA